MSEREVLIAILRRLYEEVPCCECCNSDDSYIEAREAAAEEAAKVGIVVRMIPWTESAHPYERKNPRKYGKYEVVG